MCDLGRKRVNADIRAQGIALHHPANQRLTWRPSTMPCTIRHG